MSLTIGLKFLDGAMRSLFPIGKLVVTPDVLGRFPFSYLDDCLERHLTGDWGEIDELEKVVNNQSISTGGRVHSSYHSDYGTLWIITEGNTPVTTLLVPDNY